MGERSWWTSNYQPPSTGDFFFLKQRRCRTINPKSAPRAHDLIHSLGKFPQLPGFSRSCQSRWPCETCCETWHPNCPLLSASYSETMVKAYSEVGHAGLKTCQDLIPLQWSWLFSRKYLNMRSSKRPVHHLSWWELSRTGGEHEGVPGPPLCSAQLISAKFMTLMSTVSLMHKAKKAAAWFRYSSAWIPSTTRTMRVCWHSTWVVII